MAFSLTYMEDGPQKTAAYRKGALIPCCHGGGGLRHYCSIGDNSFSFVLVVVAPQTSACDLSQSLLSWNLSLQIYNKLFDQPSNSSIIYLYRFMDYRNFSLCSNAY